VTAQRVPLKITQASGQTAKQPLHPLAEIALGQIPLKGQTNYGNTRRTPAVASQTPPSNGTQSALNAF